MHAPISPLLRPAGDKTAGGGPLGEVAAVFWPVLVDQAGGSGVVQHGAMLAGMVQESDPGTPFGSLIDPHCHAEPYRVSFEVTDLVLT